MRGRTKTVASWQESHSTQCIETVAPESVNLDSKVGRNHTARSALKRLLLAPNVRRLLRWQESHSTQCIETRIIKPCHANARHVGRNHTARSALKLFRENGRPRKLQVGRNHTARSALKLRMTERVDPLTIVGRNHTARSALKQSLLRGTAHCEKLAGITQHAVH